MTAKERGDKAETAACNYLQKNKLILIDRNFHSRLGEIDLIMEDKKTLVFIEVRYRKNCLYLNPLESIDSHKRGRIIKTAQSFLLSETRFTDRDIRFDVVAITGDFSDFTIEWIKDAFQA